VFDALKGALSDEIVRKTGASKMNIYTKSSYGEVYSAVTPFELSENAILVDLKKIDLLSNRRLACIFVFYRSKPLIRQ